MAVNQLRGLFFAKLFLIFAKFVNKRQIILFINNQNNYTRMKETYVQPDVQVLILAIEHNIMSDLSIESLGGGWADED